MHPTSTRSGPAFRLCGFGGLLCCFSLTACQANPRERATTPEQRSAATPIQNDEYAKLGYGVEWRGFPTLSPGKTIARFEVLGDIVAAQDTAGLVCVLETRSGERRWSDPVDNPLTKFVGLNRDGKRLVVSSETQVYSFDTDTGALLTKDHLDQVVNTRPAQASEILVYGCNNGQILGQLTLNGFRQWGSYARGAIEVDPVMLGSSGIVAIVSSGGEVVFLDGLTGSLRGRARIFSGPDVALGASASAVFVASRDHSLYAFGVDGGRLLWRTRTEAPLRFAPVFHEGRVYCDMGDDGLTAFDASTGNPAWSNKAVHGSLIGLHDGRFIVWDGATATTVDPARGGTVAAVELANVSMIRADQFVDGRLYLASKAGVITKLTPRK